MKPLIALLSTCFLCSCADMVVTRTQIAGASTTIASGDSKDYYDSKNGVHMVTNCGVGAANPKRSTFVLSALILRFSRATRRLPQAKCQSAKP